VPCTARGTHRLTFGLKTPSHGGPPRAALFICAAAPRLSATATVTFFDQHLVGSTTRAPRCVGVAAQRVRQRKAFPRANTAGTKPAIRPRVSRRALRVGLTNRTEPPAVFPPRFQAAAGGRPTPNRGLECGTRRPIHAAEPTRRCVGQYVVRAWSMRPKARANRDGSPRSDWQFPAVTSKMLFWERTCRGVRMERDLWAWQ
jgi:hypothetical protein